MANQIDIITTSLEALIQRATNAGNQGPDTAAIDAFCGLINKEPECIQVAAKFITAKVHSLQEWEALQALLLLENCMKRCGSAFHAEIGKFRFLNELIKLVSPKYLGAHTPEPVRRRVLELMYTWTIQYPKESKIKEAYDMLKKQGVIQEEPPPCQVLKEVSTPRQQASILQDKQSQQLLQKLLQSKNPQDLQAANKLIKSMVKEEERRVEEKWRDKLELEKVGNNCNLLNEMLDSYQVGVSSEQELELIKELYTSCQNLKIGLFKLATTTTDPAFCTEVLTVNDELDEVFVKYNSLIVDQGPSRKVQTPAKKQENIPSLLDLTPSPTQEAISTVPVDNFASLCLSSPAPACQTSQPSISLDALRDVFSEIVEKPAPLLNNQPMCTVTNFMPSMNDSLMYVQSAIQPNNAQVNDILPPKESVKSKGFEELDVLSEALLKQSLANMKKPLDEEVKENGERNGQSPLNSYLADDMMLILGDNHINPSEPVKVETKAQTESEIIKGKTKEENGVVLQPLGDLKITLESIKHSSVPPFQVLDQKNGISVALYLAKDCPRADVSVFVVTTSSKNESPLENFLFQPVVPKCCRLRLLPPSSTTLPAYKPFLPPSAITQLMLIASPTKEPIKLKYVVSYTMDEETITEMGEVEELLMKEN
ncbi:ADP-ribosylation factor-binding protein GGA3 [Cimex lectularius]|uniref:ADP-ribosylation factor-binding protein GGA1 n=1 Tax=Cimex lectularius TaxID=79782 RepID=A0A8I6RYF2_CIMLE|nr:ADP-ribosylation factor-binding protein GGA3 [Cimex lectularius]